MFNDYVDEQNVTAAILMKKVLAGQKRQHAFWVHDIYQNRLTQGAFHLVKELRLDPPRFHDYFRMTSEEMETVMTYIAPDLERQTRSRKPLTPQDRFMICLRQVTNATHQPPLTHVYLFVHSQIIIFVLQCGFNPLCKLFTPPKCI